MGDAFSHLLDLRTVTFHHRRQSDGPLQHVWIAEEVEQLLPELVVHDTTGQVETLAYHELSPLLLNELQKEHAINQAQHVQIEALNAEVKALVARLDAQTEKGTSSP